MMMRIVKHVQMVYNLWMDFVKKCLNSVKIWINLDYAFYVDQDFSSKMEDVNWYQFLTANKEIVMIFLDVSNVGLIII